MAEGGRSWRPTKVSLVAGAIVTAGVLLTGLNWAWVALVGVGAFGPGLLRELGWLRDKDEFQLAAARRAGYHGFLAAGLVGFALIAHYRTRQGVPADPGPPVELVVSVLWFIWLLSSLLSYWGAVRTAQRLLLIFGTAWGLFALADGFSDGLVSGIMHLSVVVPFFVLSWLAGRAPRIAGLLLLAAAVFFCGLFRLQRVLTDPFDRGVVFVVIFFAGPLLAAGVGLLRHRASES